MQKVRQTYSKRYPKVKLFKDDIDSLFTIFEKNFEHIEIIIDGYKITKLDDINQLKKSVITDLSIEGKLDYKNPNVLEENAELKLTKEEPRLYLADEANTKLRGVQYQIEATLKRRRRKTNFLSHYWILPILTILFFTLYILILTTTKSTTNNAVVDTVFVLIIALPPAIWILLDLKLNQSIIELRDSSTKINFLSRKKDDILIALIAAIFGFIFGILGTLITLWISK